MADMRESQGGGLGEERDDFTLQSSVRGEEAKMVEYLADGDLLVLLGGNCRGHCTFVFIPFITWGQLGPPWAPGSSREIRLFGVSRRSFASQHAGLRSATRPKRRPPAPPAGAARRHASRVPGVESFLRRNPFFDGPTAVEIFWVHVCRTRRSPATKLRNAYTKTKKHTRTEIAPVISQLHFLILSLFSIRP